MMASTSKYLIERLRDNYAVVVEPQDGEAFELTGPRLGNFLESMQIFRTNMSRLTSRGFPADALKIALTQGLHDRAALENNELLERVSQIIEASGFHSVSIDTAGELPAIRFVSRRDGVDRILRLDRQLISSVEYRALVHNQQGLDAMLASGFKLRHGNSDDADVTEHENVSELIEVLFESAKKGLSVQRYKGLGEMNAEQLWETTMDPERRNLLQVRIEDAITADGLFQTLMGDQVEPRRDFIQENALAANVDI